MNHLIVIIKESLHSGTFNFGASVVNELVFLITRCTHMKQWCSALIRNYSIKPSLEFVQHKFQTYHNCDKLKINVACILTQIWTAGFFFIACFTVRLEKSFGSKGKNTFPKAQLERRRTATRNNKSTGSVLPIVYQKQSYCFPFPVFSR